MEIIFLGTGAANNTPGVGKSKRLESSIFIKDNLNILIDVTQFFFKQAKYLKKVDAVFITHGHLDACGGINDFQKWLIHHKITEVPLFAHRKTIKVIKEHFSCPNIKLIPIKNEQTLKLSPLEITPYEIPHSRDPNFPVFAYKIKGEKTVIYASDMANLTEKFKKICQGIDTLIVDGSTYNRKIFAHLRIDKDLPELCNYNVGQIIFTHIGKSVPPYEQLKKIVNEMCPKAIPAYDGLKVLLK